jgi:hypothetical protein
VAPAPRNTRSAMPKPPAEKSIELFLAALDHPLKPEILALRQIILDADPGIGEDIKWNAPSFYTSEHFATFQLRAKQGVQIILHLGAKPRSGSAAGIAIDDPAGLLEWLAPDRASVTFHSLEDIQAKQAAFTALIRLWIRYV